MGTAYTLFASESCIDDLLPKLQHLAQFKSAAGLKLLCTEQLPIGAFLGKARKNSTPYALKVKLPGTNEAAAAEAFCMAPLITDTWITIYEENGKFVELEEYFCRRP